MLEQARVPVWFRNRAGTGRVPVHVLDHMWSSTMVESAPYEEALCTHKEYDVLSTASMGGAAANRVSFMGV